MRGKSAALALILLAGCDRIPSQSTDRSEALADAGRDASEETARKDADTATAAELASVRSRLDQLELESQNNLDEHSRMMNAVVETRNADWREIERIRDHYNQHLRIYHGVQ